MCTVRLSTQHGDKQTTAELSKMKGQMVAVERASIAKTCDFSFRAKPGAFEFGGNEFATTRGTNIHHDESARRQPRALKSVVAAKVICASLILWLVFPGHAREAFSVDDKMAQLTGGMHPRAAALLEHDAYTDILFTDAKAILDSGHPLADKSDLARLGMQSQDQSSQYNMSKGEEVSCTGLKSDHLAVVVIAGQSNAGNVSRTDDLYVPRHVFFNLNVYDGKCYVAGSIALGANGYGSSFVLPLADDLLDTGLYSSVLIAPIPVNGSYIEEWRPDGGRYFRRFVRVLDQLRGAGLNPTFLLWHQGEGNAAPLNTHWTIGLFGSGENHRPIDVTADLREAARLGYIRHFYEIVAALRKIGMEAPVFPAIATICGHPNIEPSIRAAQMSLPDDAWGIESGPDTDQIDFATRYDRCHFSVRGQAIVARDFVTKLTEFLRKPEQNRSLDHEQAQARGFATTFFPCGDEIRSGRIGEDFAAQSWTCRQRVWLRQQFSFLAWERF
jgi:hypothetical protein